MKNIRNGTRSCDPHWFVCSAFDDLKFRGLGNMDATCVFHSHPVLRFPTSSPFSKHCYLGKSSQSLNEVADGISAFVPQKGFYHFSISNRRSDGDKRGRQSHERKAVSGRSEKGDETESSKRPQAFGGKKSKSSDQQEIIALLRRIQISISKRDSQQGQGIKTSSNPEKDKPYSSESILDVLRESGKEVEGKISNGDTEKVLTKTRGVSRKKKVAEHPQETKFKLTRLPSSFVRKSPIPSPSPSAPREVVLDLNDEDKQVQAERRLEKMKLTELKELAKSRKIKGYSKLKKGELIDILGAI
ncbi:SAP-like protein BP-73 [Senna tora]|uniref:SAP-like protein BP-73 n=1 Tax=Senna tora TaxID=362788 RepID=A0A834SFC5_9FABA|nr:SAP-like protein BP-73 [Senna tora]